MVASNDKKERKILLWVHSNKLDNRNDLIKYNHNINTIRQCVSIKLNELKIYSPDKEIFMAYSDKNKGKIIVMSLFDRTWK